MNNNGNVNNYDICFGNLSARSRYYAKEFILKHFVLDDNARIMLLHCNYPNCEPRFYNNDNPESILPQKCVESIFKY